jgi:hypothetical protein
MRRSCTLAAALAHAVAALAPPPRHVRMTPAAPLPIPTAAQLNYAGQISGLLHFGMSTFFHDGDP